MNIDARRMLRLLALALACGALGVPRLIAQTDQDGHFEAPHQNVLRADDLRNVDRLARLVAAIANTPDR